MNHGLVLAKIAGIMLILIGISVLHTKSISKIIKEFERNSALIWTWGFISTLLGLIALSIYRSWSESWMTLITILGWAALLKGIAIMIFPASSWHSISRKALKSGWVNFVGLLAFVVGIVILLQAFTM